MKNVVGEVKIDLVRGEWFLDFFENIMSFDQKQNDNHPF